MYLRIGGYIMKQYIAIAYLAIICGYASSGYSMMKNFTLTPPNKPAIHEAVEKQDNKRIRNLITDAYNVNTPNNLGNRPLHIAAIKDLNTVIDTLMEYKADIDAQNSFYATPLILAIQHNNINTAQKLIAYKANCETPQINKPLWKPLHIVNNIPMLRTLLNRCNNINSRNNFNRTPLHLFCYSGNIKAVILNIQYGSDMYATNNAQTPFSIVYEQNHIEIARILNTMHTIRMSENINHVFTPQTDQHTRITFANMLLGQKLYSAAHKIIYDANTSSYARGKILLHAHTLQARDINDEDYTALQTCIDAIISRNDAHSIIHTMLTIAYIRTKYGILSYDILKNLVAYYRHTLGAYRNPITGNTFAHALAQSPCHKNNIPGLVSAVIDTNSLHNKAQYTPDSIALYNNKIQFISDYYSELQAYTMHKQQKTGLCTDIVIKQS